MSQHRKFYKPAPISLPQKNLLQLACTYGDLPCIQSLLKSGDFNVNDPDQESNCSALHASVYHRLYGVSALLTANGARWGCKDFDGCSVWDYLNDNREFCRSINDRCLIYSWGNNFTWNLGIESGVVKHAPSPVKGLERANAKKIIVSKYHTVFLDQNGEVYSCGIGEGGRLGHGNEETYLSFKRIESLNDKIIDICAGNGHTLFLSEQGCIFSCGMNDYGQLGVGNTAESTPTHSLFPTKLNHKDIRNKFFSFIACGNYHSAFCTERKIYTFGCNFGQLGYPIGIQGDIQLIPKVVNAFTLRNESKLVSLAASDNVTVGLLSNNFILVFANFKCTFYNANKSNLGLAYAVSFSFIQLSVYSRIPSTHDKSCAKYDILLLDNFNSVWRFSEKNNSIQLCRFEKGCDLKFSQFALGNTVFLVTIYGEVFQCQLPAVLCSDLFNRPVSTLSLVDKLDLENSKNPILSLSRIDFLHNTLNFYTDSECGNFFVSLLDPNAHLELLPRIQSGTYHSDLKSRFQFIQDNQPNDCITLISEDGKKLFVDSYFFYFFLSSIYHNPPKLTSDFPFSLSDQIYKSTLNYIQLFNIIETAYLQRNEAPRETLILISELHSHCSFETKYKTQLPNPKPLNFKIFPELHDTVINSIDNESFKCHKCVLIARSEYFASMLSFGWQESSSHISTLNLQFSLLILRIVIEYIYTDRFPYSIQEQSLYQLLIASDHFLLSRLKDWSEAKLAMYLSVDNVVPVLELSSMYNAQQLLITCIEFICVNFGWLISKRELESLDLEMLNLVSDCAQTRARRKEMQNRIAYQYDHYPNLVEEFLTKGQCKELNRKPTPKEMSGRKSSRLKKRSESGKRADSYSSNRSTSEGSQANTEHEVSPSTSPSSLSCENWKPNWLNSEMTTASELSTNTIVSNFNNILEEERSNLVKNIHSPKLLSPHPDFEVHTSKLPNRISWGIACNHLKKPPPRRVRNSTSNGSSENIPKKERTWPDIETPQNINFNDIYQQQRNLTDPTPLYSDPSFLPTTEITETVPKIQTNSPKIKNFRSIVIEEQAMLELRQYYNAKYPFEHFIIEREFEDEL